MRAREMLAWAHRVGMTGLSSKADPRVESRVLLGSRESVPLGRPASIMKQALFADD